MTHRLLSLVSSRPGDVTKLLPDFEKGLDVPVNWFKEPAGTRALTSCPAAKLWFICRIITVSFKLNLNVALLGPGSLKAFTCQRQQLLCTVVFCLCCDVAVTHTKPSPHPLHLLQPPPCLHLLSFANASLMPTFRNSAPIIWDPIKSGSHTWAS